MEASIDRYPTSSVGFPFGKDENSGSQGQLLETVYCAQVERDWVGLGEFSSHAKNPFLPDEASQKKRDPKVVADQLGHTLDVNQNVYTQVPMELKIEAVNELEAVLVSQ